MNRPRLKKFLDLLDFWILPILMAVCVLLLILMLAWQIITETVPLWLIYIICCAWVLLTLILVIDFIAGTIYMRGWRK